jgi:TatD DNase family protein
MSTPLIDTHCHLDFEDFGPERSAVIDRGRAQGIRWFVTIGSGRGADSAKAAIELATEHSDVLATVGVHPHDASVVNDEVLQTMEAMARHERVVAVGEIGLDYHYDFSPRSAQQETFRAFVRMAKAVGKPIVIHTREAGEDTLAILREEGARDVGGVIHCFTEDEAFAKSAMDLGFDISFSGIVTFKKSESLRDVAKIVARDRLMIETDAPYLAPIPMRGKRNEPSYLPHTAKSLAATLAMDEEAFRKLTTRNAIKRFGLDRFGATIEE